MREKNWVKKILPGAIVSVLGLLWLANEMAWIKTNVPIGPVAVISAGLVLIINGYDRE